VHKSQAKLTGESLKFSAHGCGILSRGKIPQINAKVKRKKEKKQWKIPHPILDNNNVSGQPHGIAPTLNNTSEQFHNKSGQPRGVAPTDCIP